MQRFILNSSNQKMIANIFLRPPGLVAGPTVAPWSIRARSSHLFESGWIFRSVWRRPLWCPRTYTRTCTDETRARRLRKKSTHSLGCVMALRKDGGAWEPSAMLPSWIFLSTLVVVTAADNLGEWADEAEWLFWMSSRAESVIRSEECKSVARG